jgi:hypothetical protein
MRSRLTAEGFEVTCARTFLEAAPSLAPGRTDLFLIYLPETEWVRNAILTEVRRANPALPIIALTSVIADDLFQLLARFQVASVLPVRGNWQSMVQTMRNALTSSESATGGRE